MITGIGCDLSDVERFEYIIKTDCEHWLRQVFTFTEITDCFSRHYPARHFAARFAAKEAAMKALGTGIIDTGSWREVEVVSLFDKPPMLQLHNRFADIAKKLEIRKIHLSLSHIASLAQAIVIMENADK